MSKAIKRRNSLPLSQAAYTAWPSALNLAPEKDTFGPPFGVSSVFSPVSALISQR